MYARTAPCCRFLAHVWADLEKVHTCVKRVLVSDGFETDTASQHEPRNGNKRLQTMDYFLHNREVSDCCCSCSPHTKYIHVELLQYVRSMYVLLSKNSPVFAISMETLGWSLWQQILNSSTAFWSKGSGLLTSISAYLVTSTMR